MELEKIGRLAFYAGIVVSVLLGWMNMANATVILIVLGIIVGLLNVTTKETQGFLLAALVLVSAGVALSAGFGEPIKSILQAFIAFTAAAAVVVALKEVYNIEKGR
ncbi:Uncharacterised protein [uncultured archaeon]|nr:Uncharacterised protein [uncultured archaeon]